MPLPLGYESGCRVGELRGAHRSPIHTPPDWRVLWWCGPGIGHHAVQPVCCIPAYGKEGRSMGLEINQPLQQWH